MLKSGDHAGHPKSPLRDTRRPGNMCLNFECYVEMLQNFLQPRMEEIVENEGFGDVWFQQDGATADTARISFNVLRHTGRLVSLRGDLGWPAWSPI